MYILTELVERIKSQAKLKNLSTAKLLEDCELSKNTLVSMNTRGSWIQSNSLAKIADRLDCSVDYLLGRTENPNSHNIPVDNSENSSTNDQISTIISICKQLNTVELAKVLIYVDNIRGNKND